MTTAAGLPLPSLSRGRFAHAKHSDCSDISTEAIFAYTDEVLFETSGVRIAFTERTGGLSERPYNSLNLKVPGFSDTSQEQQCPDPQVPANRRLLTAALGCSGIPVISPNQVHEDTVVSITSADEASLARAMAEVSEGADAIVCCTTGVAALLCFADCVPLVFVAPNGAFAVVHCGWRGVVAHVAVKAYLQLVQEAQCAPDQLNVYIGPYIHQECFEVSADTAQLFRAEFDESIFSGVQPDSLSSCHVDLGRALRLDLEKCGVDSARIADCNLCTVCNTDRFFSYRASHGVCGRHGAFVFRQGASYVSS